MRGGIGSLFAWVQLLDPSPVLDMAAEYLNTSEAHAQARVDPDEDANSEVASPAPGGVSTEVVDLAAQPREDEEEGRHKLWYG